MTLTISSLSEQFGRSTTDITWGITLVLMLRSVGAILFGIAADRYGRKWPFIVNNILFIALELVSRRVPLMHHPAPKQPHNNSFASPRPLFNPRLLVPRDQSAPVTVVVVVVFVVVER